MSIFGRRGLILPLIKATRVPLAGGAGYDAMLLADNAL